MIIGLKNCQVVLQPNLLGYVRRQFPLLVKLMSFSHPPLNTFKALLFAILPEVCIKC